MKKYLLTCLAALAAAWAQAGVGLTELPGLPGDGRVTVFYPTAAADQPLKRGPFTLNLAQHAEPERGNGRLVVISHGSGGNPWVHSDLARSLVEAGFIVAMPEHHADNARDHSALGPESWKLRPAEVSRAIDAVAKDARFAPLLALDKVGMYGMSAGGHTALALAGGRWSPALFKPHCEAHIAEDGALLSPPPPAQVMDAISADLLGDPPGFDRSQMPEVDRKITAFFRGHLLP